MTGPASNPLARVLIEKSAIPKRGEQVPDDLSDSLGRLPQAFGQQGLGSDASNLQIKSLTGHPGLYRLRVGDYRACFMRAGQDFLVFLVGHRSRVYERLERMRLTRKGEGVRFIELERTSQTAPAIPKSATLKAVLSARTKLPEQQNPFSPFENAELMSIDGVDDNMLEFLRTIPASVDIGNVLGGRVGDPDLAFLLSDIWERPGVHRDAFDRGETPSAAGLTIELDELSERLRSTDSETEMVSVGAGAIAKLLSGTIEDWMVYLHPDQRAIANAQFNGPSRVRGGPGTGKTVVALHRARILARQRTPDGEKVLLTTFLRTLPKVWEGLMGLLDPRALDKLEVVHLDRLAGELVRGAGEKANLVAGGERQAIARKLLTDHGLKQRLAGNPDLLLEEFDAFLTGRGLTSRGSYLEMQRRGGGSPLPRADRERVYAAYEDYRAQLSKRGLTDFGLVRLRALEIAEAGGGPRFAGVVVDEAQDLTEIGIRLLAALDASENHCNLTIVGDGQQSIYPGGFSLRSVGLDVRGRSRVLTSNWRNTWSIWTAAKAVMEGEDFDDLDEEDVGLRPTGEEPGPLTIGDAPVLHAVRSPGEELDLLEALIAERIEAGVDGGDIAVLVDSQPRDVARRLRQAGIQTTDLEEYDGEHAKGVLVGTMRRAKGLEFKEVFIGGLSQAEWPPRWFVPPDLPEEQREERLALVRRTLFVGMTRARDRLQILSGGPPCALIDEAAWAMDVRKY